MAQAGFDSGALETVRGRLAGVSWQGRVLKGSDMMPADELHYVWHAFHRQEWPEGTSFDEYIDSIRAVVLDPESGEFTSRYRGTWQLGVVGRSGTLRGVRGGEWVLVEYRLATRHWMTAFQPGRGLEQLQDARRRDLRWLRQPYQPD